MTRTRDRDGQRPVPGQLLALLVLCVLTVLAFVWQTIDERGATEALVAYRSALYLQPWRAISSGFIHQGLPHVIFNLVTFWIAGARTCRRYGAAWFLGVFFLSMFVGQVCHTMLYPSQIVGISGGVCGLYGFLFVREWQGSLSQTLRRWAFFWIYPVALLVLFVLHTVGLLSIASVNHLIGIAAGGLVALGAGALWRQLPIIVMSLASIVFVLYRPWDTVWQAVHARYTSSDLLRTTECTPVIGPSTDIVMRAPVLVVSIVNPLQRHVFVRYYDPNGDLVDAFDSRAEARSFRPLQGSIWRIDDENGVCISQFIARRSGIVEVRRAE